MDESSLAPSHLQSRFPPHSFSGNDPYPVIVLRLCGVVFDVLLMQAEVCFVSSCQSADACNE